jgi:hypothetical protein
MTTEWVEGDARTRKEMRGSGPRMTPSGELSPVEDDFPGLAAEHGLEAFDIVSDREMAIAVLVGGMSLVTQMSAGVMGWRSSHRRSVVAQPLFRHDPKWRLDKSPTL